MYELKETEMIFIFTGPDGSGRKTIADMVGATLGMKKVISCTTRQGRGGEIDGQDYHFISREAFEEAEKRGEFIESTEIDGHFYGIKNSDIERRFQSKGCIYLILNPQGAKTLKNIYGDRVTRLFIYADKETVLRRQIERGDPQDVIDHHMSHYNEAMAHMPECRHAFENSDLAHTVFAITNSIETYLNRNLVELD